MAEADAIESRACHDQRIRRAHRAAVRQSLPLPIVELAHAGVGGAAEVNDFDVRKQPPGIGRAPHRVGAELQSLAARLPQRLQRDALAQHQRVTGRIARQRGADHEPRRVLIARHVLERMHRCLEFAGQHRGTDLRDEGAALAAMRQQLAGLIEIARGVELDDLDIEIGHDGGQAARDLFRLCQRHRALAGADPQSNSQALCSF